MRGSHVCYHERRQKIDDQQQPAPSPALVLEELEHLLPMLLPQIRGIEPKQQPVETGRQGSTAFARAARRTRSSFEASAESAASPVRVMR